MGCASIKESKKSPIIPKRESALKISNIEDVKFSPGNFVTKKVGALRQDYTLSAKIGSGAFGYVRLAVH